MLDDPWLLLLQGETEVNEILYSVQLECTFSEITDNAFSTFLSVAITLGTAVSKPFFPINATLHWGEYTETLLITEQGRVKFPDIPFSTAYDEKQKLVKSELNLTLEKTKLCHE